VNGNILAENAAGVNVYAGSSVSGNIQILHSGAADIQSVSIQGGLHFEENDLPLNAAGNTIAGNLQAWANTGGVSITGNTIAGNLLCQENSPPPTGSGNIVSGNMEDQCADLVGEATPEPTDSPPAPTSTPPAPTSTPPVPSQTPSDPAIDQEAPTVYWTAPVLAGERYDLLEGEQVSLEVEASDNVSLAQVTFQRWDAVNEQYITLGILEQPPFQITVNASSLNPEWNQVFVVATDLAGNTSERAYIWLYKLVPDQLPNQTYIPFLRK
jgi:hypothetical protein